MKPVKPPTTNQYPMRTACECGSPHGTITVKKGQNCVYCSRCGEWKYNAPKSEVEAAIKANPALNNNHANDDSLTPGSCADPADESHGSDSLF